MWSGPEVVGAGLLLIAISGAVVAALRPQRNPALAAAFLLIMVAAVPLSLGGTGSLFLPSLLLLPAAVVCELRKRRTGTREGASLKEA
jgi:hypothetical protein